MSENINLIQDPKTPMDEVQNYLTALAVWAVKRNEWTSDMLDTAKSLAMTEACQTVNDLAATMSPGAWELFRAIANQSKEKGQSNVEPNGPPSQ